jgi:lipoate-protein ligase A
MAVDEVLLEGVRLGVSPPTLRLYRWETPSLSFGHAQRILPAPGGYDPQSAVASGLALVRRPTGGRAVLHAGDITYAIAANGLPAGVRASYGLLAAGLTHTLAHLGVTDARMGTDKPSNRSAACFSSATAADLSSANGKMMGSAQARRGTAVLQHGTLYTDYPNDLARLVFGADYTPIADLKQVLGRAPAWRELKEAFAVGLGLALVTAWEPGGLTAWEQEQAELSRSRYRVSTLH